MAIALHHKVQMQDTLQYPRVEMAPTPYQEISLGKKFMLSKTLYYAALKKSFKMPDRFLTLSQINSSTVSSDTLNSVPVVMSTETGTQTEAIGFTAMELGNLKTTPQQNEESMAGSSQSTELFPNVTAAFPVPPPDHKAIADIPGSVAATENSQYTSHATSSDWQLGEWIATDQDTETTWGDLGNPTEESVCSLASSMVPLMSQSAHSSTPSADGVATELPIGCASIGNATVGCKAEYGANESQSARNGNSAAKRKRRAHPNTTEKPLATKKSRTTGARANLGALPLAPTTETNLSKPRKGSVAGAAQELQKLGKGPCELCKRFIQDRINDYIIYFPHPGTSLRSKSHFTDRTYSQSCVLACVLSASMPQVILLFSNFCDELVLFIPYNVHYCVSTQSDMIGRMKLSQNQQRSTLCEYTVFCDCRNSAAKHNPMQFSIFFILYIVACISSRCSVCYNCESAVCHTCAFVSSSRHS
eukprot:m.175249 g.175249  ORF g.175249 m.175249 type:complete len:475 (+) comp18348_c0_seq26:173-1597(+)